MGKTMKKCEKIFHFLNGKEDKKRIQKELEEERKKYTPKNYN